jgi:hypothetical protein
MINRSKVSIAGHEMAREEIAFAKSEGRAMTYAKALKIGMKIAWRRAKDAAFTERTGLVYGFQVVEPKHLWA